jgi:hypothetical protein
MTRNIRNTMAAGSGDVPSTLADTVRGARQLIGRIRSILGQSGLRPGAREAAWTVRHRTSLSPKRW